MVRSQEAPHGTDVAIVGGGPAGIAAAIQCSRYGLSAMLVERRAVGGQLRTANLVENYPGFPAGVSGRELAERMARQLSGHPVEVVAGEALGVSDGPAVAVSGRREPVLASAAIVCTGAEPRMLDRPVPPDVAHLVACDIDDGIDWKGTTVAVIGGGEAAFDRAVNLSGRGASVTLLSRSEPTAMPLLVSRARDAGVALRHPFAVSGVRASGGLAEVASHDGETLSFGRVVVSIGKDSSGRCPLLGVHAATARPSGYGFSTCAIPGVFLAGDLVAGPHRQAAWAAGSGLAAATAAKARVEATGGRR